MRNYFIFNGKDSREFGLYINGHKTFDSPEKKYSLFSVPGKNGEYADDIGTFSNVELAYNSSFIFEDFDENFSNLKNYLLSQTGYQRLVDTYHPDEYRMAIFRKAIQPTMSESNEVGAFDLIFECQPQRFLLYGENETILVSDNASERRIFFAWYNGAGPFNAKPLIKVSGSGTIRMQCNIGARMIKTYSFTVSNNDNKTIYIDSEILDCYRIDSDGNKENANSDAHFTNYEFPEIIPQTRNYFEIPSTVTDMSIIPRWFKL